MTAAKGQMDGDAMGKGDGSPVDNAALLRVYLRDRDVPCPACGYNLRNLRQNVCPECGHEIVLEIGQVMRPVGWLVMTILPGIIFIGLMVLIFIMGSIYGAAAPAVFSLIFGFFSGWPTVTLIINCSDFIKKPVWVQSGWAAMSWILHIALLVIFIAIASEMMW